MPELPEVQTIVSDLQKFLPKLKILDVWTDHEKMFPAKSGPVLGGKNALSRFEHFKKEVSGEKILKVERKGKNILIHLSQNKTILVHQKMTGHLLYGKWRIESGRWIGAKEGPIKNDPMNRFIHLVFDLSDGKQLALSDLRKFAKVLLWPTGNLSELEDVKNLGPDPTAEDFDFKKFQEQLADKKGIIKTILMDQTVFAGIGNIYSDEILWQAGVHPLKEIQKLKPSEIEKIYKAIKPILKQAIKARGSSNVDYRDALGRKGKYQEMQNAYKQEGEKCKKKDGGIIKRIKIGGRSTHFCPVHQIL